MSHLRHTMNGLHHADVTHRYSSSICVLGLMQSFNEAEPQLVSSCGSSAEDPSKWQQHPSQPCSCFWTQLPKSVAEVPSVLFADVTSIINSPCAPIWTQDYYSHKQMKPLHLWAVGHFVHDSTWEIAFENESFAKFCFRNCCKGWTKGWCWIFMGLNWSCSGSPQRLSWWFCFL